jgi:hypothetical protein
MVTFRDDVAHWHKRAAEARTIAMSLTSREAKRRMLSIAINYLKIAREAEARTGVGARRPDLQPKGPASVLDHDG